MVVFGGLLSKLVNLMTVDFSSNMGNCGGSNTADGYVPAVSEIVVCLMFRHELSGVIV